MSHQIEVIFCPYILLNTFTLPDVISSVRTSGKLHAAHKKQQDQFQGYKLAILSALFLYLDNIVRTSNIIGIPSDPNLQDYWSYTKTPGKDKLKSALRRSHAMSAIIARVQSLMTEVLTTKSWDDLPRCLGHVQDFSFCLRRIFIKSYKYLEKINSRWQIVDSEEALYRRAYDILWTEIMDFKKLRGTYCEVYRDYRPISKDIYNELEDPGDRETTRLHRKNFEDFPSGFPPNQWAAGCASTILESLYRLSPTPVQLKLENLREQVKQIEDWIKFNQFSRNIRDILSQAPNFFNPSSRWLFKQGRPVAVADRRGIMLSVRSFSNIEQVKSMLGNMLRIVEIESPAAPLNFRCLLDGAVVRAKRTGGKVLVVEAKHPAGRRAYDYSFAILMPAYSKGIIPMNASMWWVFYDICNDFSGTATRMLVEVKKSLQDDKEFIEVLPLRVDKDEFLSLCEDPGYNYLKDEISDLERLDSEIRGAFPELLLLAYLAAHGCSPIKCHLKPKFLDKELDVVGVKWVNCQPSEVIIFESKGKATILEDLQKELDYFADKLGRVQQNVQQLFETLFETLEIPHQANVKVKGIFVSMAELNEDEVKIPASISLWDFNKLQRELTNAKIPKEYRSLLKRKILSRPFSLDAPFLKSFFGE